MRENSTTLYLHVFDWPSNNKLHVPGLSGKITSARVLGLGEEALFQINKGEVVVDIPTNKPNSHIGVVAIEFEGRPVVFELPKISSETVEFVANGKVTLSVGSPDLEIRYATINNKNTMDMVVPTTIYSEPLYLNDSCTVIAQGFYKNKPVTNMVTKLTDFNLVSGFIFYCVLDIVECNKLINIVEHKIES